MFNPREQRIEFFEDTTKHCRDNVKLSDSVKKSVLGTKFYFVDGKIYVFRSEN